MFSHAHRWRVPTALALGVTIAVSGCGSATSSGGSAAPGAETGPASAVASSNVCDLAQADLANLQSAGNAYRAGQLDVATLRARLDALRVRWDRVAATAGGQGGDRAAAVHGLAGEVRSLMSQAQYAAVNDVPGGDDYENGDGRGLIMFLNDVRSGDVALDFRNACSKSLSR